MITYSLSQKLLFAYGKQIYAWCDVRNELNGRRKLFVPSEVQYSTNADGSRGQPYMPRVFPVGNWHIFGTEVSDDPMLAPVVIKTDAHQPVRIWALAPGGGYDHETQDTIEDWAYELHLSQSETTLGCIHIDSKEDVLWLAAEVEQDAYT